MRTIGVVTVARSDYGIYRPVLRRLEADARFELRLYVAAAHLAVEHGTTVAEIEADGFAIAARIPTLGGSDEAVDVAAGLGRAVEGFARALGASRPDLLLVLGDRLEMLAAATAALPLRVPLAHLHGGEASEGSFDESIRHALTKLSHLHFAATEAAAGRIRQLGEEPWRIVVSGAPALDAALQPELLSDDELEERVGMPLDPPPLVVSFHPATLDPVDPGTRARELLAAVEASGVPSVFTYPNADPGGAAIRAAVDEFVQAHGNARAVASLGTRAYFSLLARAAAMVGNSSSGIIEAASFGLPVVNVGIRQEGRLRPANVIDVGDDRDAILEGLRRSLSPAFREQAEAVVNPYGDGHASERIVERLAEVELGPALLVKRFRELDG